MTYNKRRYRRVSTHGIIHRAWWSGTKVTLFAGTNRVWLNVVGTSEGHERPRFVAFNRPEWKSYSQREHAIYGPIIVRDLPNLAPYPKGRKLHVPF